MTLLVVCRPAPATAQAPYALDPAREAALLGSGAVGAFGAFAIHASVTPLTQDEVAELSRSDLGSFDRGATYLYSATADEVSDWLAYGLLVSPVVQGFSASVREDIGTYGTMYGETLLLTMATVQLVKGLVRRTRPYAYNPDAPAAEKTRAEARESFYSSHTAFAFASAVFMGVTFQAYEPGSPAGTWIWAGSLSVAAAIGILRYTSGEHFPTDILAGAVLGALAGLAIPALHSAGNGSPAASPATASRGLQVSFQLSL